MPPESGHHAQCRVVFPAAPSGGGPDGVSGVTCGTKPFWGLGVWFREVNLAEIWRYINTVLHLIFQRPCGADPSEYLAQEAAVNGVVDEKFRETCFACQFRSVGEARACSTLDLRFDRGGEASGLFLEFRVLNPTGRFESGNPAGTSQFVSVEGSRLKHAAPVKLLPCRPVNGGEFGGPGVVLLPFVRFLKPVHHQSQGEVNVTQAVPF